jgi:YidC/Oxa1 family membrane protein insertase
MDRKTWLAVGLSVIGIILWQWYYHATYGPYLKQQEELHKQQEIAAKAAATASPSASPAATALPSTPSFLSADAPKMTAQSETLNAVGKKKTAADFIFNNDAGGIESVRLLMHLSENGVAVTLNGDQRVPIGALATDPATPLGGFAMQTDRAHGVVTFTRRDSDGLEIEKKFTLPQEGSLEAPYVVNLSVTFHNAGTASISRPGYYLSTGSASPIHERDIPSYTRLDWSSNGRMNGIDVGWFNPSRIPLVGIETRPAQQAYTQSVTPVEWAAVASQYFCTIVSAKDVQGNSVWASRFETPQSTSGHPIYGILGAIGLPPFTVDAGKSITQTFQIYAGPKEISRLDRLGRNEEAVMNFNWFGFISKILLRAMNGLRDVLGSYAAAIIVLTLIIKGLLWPLQNKATDSMRKMSALSPKMTELREKYKDDPTKMNEELMKLYRDYGVNPFSGCLPMLVQIPIFFGFYGMLGTAIELRNSSFLWIHDLSQPDTVAHIFGFSLNILPIFMAGTMVWQMAITPKSGDPAQQRMMMFMPLIFIAFAYNYASALSLYWTTSNLFSIVQLYLTRNKPLPKLEKVKAPAKQRQAGPAAGKRRKR